MKKKDAPQDLAQGFAPGGSTSPPASKSPPAAPTRRLSAMDVQQKEFRVSRFGGYKMRDVDEFLDQITESMSAMSTEVQRSAGGSGAEAVVGTPDLDDVNRQADEIIQRARAEAARILAEARAKAETTGSPAPGRASPVVGAFLAHEREFLQNLASLVQDHVGSVKSMARSAQSPGPSSASAASPKSATTPAPAAPSKAVAPPKPAAQSRPAPPPPATEEPVRVSEPEPASVTRSDVEDPGDEAGDSSLRELFWGED